MSEFSKRSRRFLNKVASRVMPVGLKPEPPSYDVVLRNICRKFKIPEHQNLTSEQAIVLHFFNESWRKLDPEKRTEFIEKLGNDQKKNPNSMITSSNIKSYLPELLGAGGIIAAQASSFGIYVAASSMVGAVTQAVNVTLPFVFTSMSTSIAYLIGPAGWAIIALSLMAKVFGPDYKKVVHVVLIIAGTRANASIEYDKTLQNEQNTLTKLNENARVIKEKLDAATRRYRKRCLVSIAAVTAVSVFLLMMLAALR